MIVSSADSKIAAIRKAREIRGMLFGCRADGVWIPPASGVYVARPANAPKERIFSRDEVKLSSSRIINVRVHKGVVQGKALADGRWYTLNGVVKATR